MIRVLKSCREDRCNSIRALGGTTIIIDSRNKEVVDGNEKIYRQIHAELRDNLNTIIAPLLCGDYMLATGNIKRNVERTLAMATTFKTAKFRKTDFLRNDGLAMAIDTKSSMDELYENVCISNINWQERLDNMISTNTKMVYLIVDDGYCNASPEERENYEINRHYQIDGIKYKKPIKNGMNKLNEQIKNLEEGYGITFVVCRTKDAAEMIIRYLALFLKKEKEKTEDKKEKTKTIEDIKKEYEAQIKALILATNEQIKKEREDKEALKRKLAQETIILMVPPDMGEEYSPYVRRSRDYYYD